MIGMFSQILEERAGSRLPRAMVGVCVLLWLLGSVSSLYGSLSPQWTMPHCPQGTSHLPQHNQNHCLWHCVGIDAQAAAGRNPISSAEPTGASVSAGILPFRTIVYRTGVAPRGPPVTSLS